VGEAINQLLVCVSGLVNKSESGNVKHQFNLNKTASHLFGQRGSRLANIDITPEFAVKVRSSLRFNFKAWFKIVSVLYLLHGH